MFVQTVLLDTTRRKFYLTSLLKFIVEAVLLIIGPVIKSNNIIIKLLMVNMIVIRLPPTFSVFRLIFSFCKSAISWFKCLHIFIPRAENCLGTESESFKMFSEFLERPKAPVYDIFSNNVFQVSL